MLNKKNCCSYIGSIPRGKELYCTTKACYLSVEHILAGCSIHTFPIEENKVLASYCAGCNHLGFGYLMCGARNDALIEASMALECSLKSTTLKGSDPC
jgi:hypothetical protein